MDSPGGDICQAVAPDAPAGPHAATPSALSSVSGSITSTSAIALVALAKPFVVAFNSNGWLKTLLQPMHGWVKWTTEAGKGLFVRNDVVLALISGVLAHMQGVWGSTALCVRRGYWPLLAIKVYCWESPTPACLTNACTRRLSGPCLNSSASPTRAGNQASPVTL